MIDESDILERLKCVIAQHSGPVAEADIIIAETTLGVQFPTSYRIFLKHFGAGQLKYFYEIEGLTSEHRTDEPPFWLNVVDINMRMRRASRGLMPTTYVRICDDGGDYSFHLDTSNIDQNGECTVVVAGPGRDGVVIAKSFLEFVEKAAGRNLEF